MIMINSLIIILMVLLPILLIFLFYSLIKKMRLYSVVNIILLAIITMILIVFYRPTSIEIAQYTDIVITIQNNNGRSVIENIEQKKEILQLVEKQNVVRNAELTVRQPNAIEAYRITDIFIRSQTINTLFSLDTYHKESYMKMYRQYYRILNEEKFYEELIKILDSV